jgi:hypothetical protein
MSNPPARASIGDYLISARSFAEYAAMFALTEADLRGSVVDCPGGGASFTATACARGADAVAVDPVYAVPPEQLIARLDAELERGHAWARERADAYVWAFYGDFAGHAHLRERSARLFTADLRAHPERYVPASLPALPFADASVDLMLSSHLLFTYADRLDAAFHLAALRELARIARRQVRVYPLVDQAGQAPEDLVGTLLADLTADGLRAKVVEVDYEFQRGARHMLVVDVTNAPISTTGRSLKGQPS